MNKRDSDTQRLVKLYFRRKPHPKKRGAEVVDVNGDGVALCKRCCEELKDDSGHGNLRNHIATKRDDYRDALAEQSDWRRQEGQ